MEFLLLGPLQVEEDGRPLPLGGRRQRAVLTHLLLSRETPISSDWLIDQVWGDAAPGAVRTSLHTYVSRLRATLGRDRLETVSTGYVLHARPDEVDALRFEALLPQARLASGPAAADAYDAGLAEWRGRALGDLADEPSLQPEARRLDGLREAAIGERIGVRLALGHVTAVLPELEDRLRRDPLREDLWAHYVLALYRSGRQADALAAFERIRRVLRDELGAEPSEQLRTLHGQVLRQAHELTLQGTALHGYRLLGVLGQGSSAVVHRAVQPQVDREVALKVLRPHLARDADVVRRFEAAARAAVGLESPHVVPVHDYWQDSSGACVVMRLLRGGTLQDLLDAGPADLGTALRVAEHVAHALAAFRGHALAPGTVSPADVLLDEAANAYLSAFSLTRALLPPAGPGREVTATDAGPHGSDVPVLGRLALELLAGVPSVPAAALRVAEDAAAGGSGSASDVLQLVDELRAAAAPPVPTQRAAVGRRSLRNPYKGLRPFGEQDSGDFFGREAVVERLVSRLVGTGGRGHGVVRFLAVVGPSGSGKSSLVRAGLVPALRARAAADGAGWCVVDLVPGSDPFAELEKALRRVAPAPLAAGTTARLRSDPGSLARTASALVAEDGRNLLLVVDQLEELFTLADGEDRTAFVDALVAAATAPAGRLRVVVTIRADFYDRPLSVPTLAGLLQHGTEVVVPLTAEGLEQAVVEPAELVGVRVEPALLAQVVADVGSAPSSLPLLQYALTELFDRRREDVLTLADYRAVGGVSGALVRRADEVYARLTRTQQRVARQVLLQLVHPDDADVGTRRRVRQRELVQRTEDPDAAEAVVAAFGSARLLSFDREAATRQPTVEVAHEALLRQWSRARDWVEGAREDLRTERRLDAAAREWEDSGRDRSFLATGARLDAVADWTRRWSERVGWAPTAAVRDYLDASLTARTEASRQEEERGARERRLEQRSVRRLRVVAGLLAVAVAATTVLTVFGFAQQRRAEREAAVSQVRALAAAAVATLDDDPERGVLLALEAVRRSRAGGAGADVLPEAEDALHRAVVRSRLVRTVSGTGGAADWSADGLLVTGRPEQSGLVDLSDAVSGQRVHSWRGHDADVTSVAFNADGSRLLTTGGDGAVRLWDPDTRRLVWELVMSGQAWGPSFSADGRRLSAAWPQEGVARVVDVATGQVLTEVRSVPEPEATALVPDGSRVVVGGRGLAGAVVHDVATGAQVLHVGGDTVTAYGVDVSPDGRWLATSGLDGRARVWSLPDGSRHGTMYTSAAVVGFDWSADSMHAVIGGDDGVARVYEVRDGGIREEVRLSATSLRGVTGVAFSPDGDRVLLGDSTRTTTQVWDVSAGGSRQWLTVEVPDGQFVGADFSGDGRHLLTSAPEGRLSVRRLDDGRPVRSTAAHRGTVSPVRTSPDGGLVAGFVGGAARVWRVDTAAEVFSVPVEGETMSWSPDGRVLALTDREGRLHVLDRTGSPVAAPGPPPGQLVAAVAFTGDGRQLRALRPTAGEAGSVQVLDEDGAELHRLPVASEHLAVDAAGRRAAVTSEPGDVTLWDLASGRHEHTLVGHVGLVWDAVFSPDGRQLATSGQDGTVRLWEVSTGQSELVLRGHRSGVYSVRFSPDGSRLVTASGDGTVRVWARDLDDLVRLAQQRLTRGLTPAECRAYLPDEECG